MGRHYEVRAASMAKTAAAKTKIYSRYGKEIYLAAKNGTDPEMNLTLKRIIAQAKSNQVPSDVINRAIEKAKGGSVDSYDFVRYEGFGPQAATVIIDCLTDNANRSLSDVRTCFNKCHYKMGVNGSVSFAYTHCGFFVFEYEDDEKILEILLENDIDVLEMDSEATIIELQVPFDQFHEARGILDTVLGEDYEYKVVEITMLPNETIDLNDEDELEIFKKFILLLEDVEDVQNIYHNVANVE